MSFFDIVLLIIIGGFGLFGLWFGFFHTLGSLAGTIFGVYLASRYYEQMATWLMGITGWGNNFSRVLMFTIAFIIINRLVGFAFWIFDKFFDVLTKLPFLSSINRLLGMALGVFEGLVTVGFVIYFMEKYPFSEKIVASIADSAVAPPALAIVAVLLPLLPEGMRLIRSGVDYVEGQIVP
jgi:membrane protein required for colicin V production